VTQQPTSIPDTTAEPAPAVNWTWAAYVAASWTWCIGMFLPVLLIRDFGLWGWVAFAIPNVFGAAMVGRWSYLLPDGRSLLEKHQRSLIWFSLITIAFHVFFIGWMVHRLLGGWAIPAFALAVIFFSIMVKLGKAGLGAWIAIIGSLLAAGLFYAAHGTIPPPEVKITSAKALDLLFLTPAIVLGFILCPHMDLTLQRARQAMPPRQAAVTFGAGYFGLFLLLVAFTLLYAGVMLVPLQWSSGAALPALLAIAIGFHMCVQGGFTTALHANEVIRRVKRRKLMTLVGIFIVVMIGLWMLGRSIVPGSRLLGYDPGEVVYRLFMSFYGLVFPAYAWAAWVWRKQPALSLMAWLAPLLVALPMFAAGFLAQQPVWIVPGVALVLLLPRLLLPASR
jgi:hypothetical protein